jgi:periplasmic protein TonB
MLAPRISVEWNNESVSAAAPAVVLPFPARDRRATQPTKGAEAAGAAGSPLAATPQLGERPTLVPTGMREWLKAALILSLAAHAIVSIGMQLRFDDELERAAGAAAALSSEGTVTIPVEVVMESVLPSAPSPTNASAPDATEALPDPQQAESAEDAPPVPQMTTLEDLLPPPPEPAPVVLPNREETAQAALSVEANAPPSAAEAAQTPAAPAGTAVFDETAPMPLPREPIRGAEKQQASPSTPTRAASPSRSAGANSNGPSGAGGAADTGGRAAISSYFARVQAHLSRHRVYPPEARASGVSGVARVVFSLGRDGRVLSVSLARGSGHGVLDRAALAMVRRAAPFPPFPSEIAASRLEMGAPIRFDLR